VGNQGSADLFCVVYCLDHASGLRDRDVFGAAFAVWPTITMVVAVLAVWRLGDSSAITYKGGLEAELPAKSLSGPASCFWTVLGTSKFWISFTRHTPWGICAKRSSRLVFRRRHSGSFG
jgi:hypothetical protein